MLNWAYDVLLDYQTQVPRGFPDRFVSSQIQANKVLFRGLCQIILGMRASQWLGRIKMILIMDEMS